MNTADINFNKQFINDFKKTICIKCKYNNTNQQCANLSIYQSPPYFMDINWYCKNFKNKINNGVIKMDTEFVKRKIPKQEFDKLNKKITHVLIYARMQYADSENNNLYAIRVDGMFSDKTQNELDEFHQMLINNQEFDKVDTQNMYRWFWKLPEPISASELNKDEILNKFIKYATQIVENME